MMVRGLIERDWAATRYALTDQWRAALAALLKAEAMTGGWGQTAKACGKGSTMGWVVATGDLGNSSDLPFIYR